jgi:hypothetical protein
MGRRPISLVLVALTLLVLPHAGPSSAAATPSLEAYRGVGAWVDVYDDREWHDPEGTVASMASYGVRTLYIETANYKAKKDIVYPAALDRFIDAAHANGLRIVSWYLPSLNNPQRDLRRSLAAIQRTTASGGTFDSFGLDIEAAVVTDPSLRTQRVLQLSAEIRSAVGTSYPLSAIIPSPRGMQRRPDYWPGFPFSQLTEYYDVFQPMSYFAYRTNGPAGAYKYIADNISIVRTKTGDKQIPIHIIGGIADDTSGPEVRGMVHAARERGILGTSLYDFDTSGPEDWRELAKMPANPVERPALPLALPATPELGNIPGSDRSHPKEVFYRAGAVSGDALLRFQAYGIQDREVALWVNWRFVRTVVPGGTGSWSDTRTTTIPGSLLSPSGPNVIAFIARGNDPDWSVWGVRRVSLG